MMWRAIQFECATGRVPHRQLRSGGHGVGGTTAAVRVHDLPTGAPV